MSPKLLVLASACTILGAAAWDAASAGTPPVSPVIVPDTAQDILQAQLAIQQAQAQARLAASQAKVQAALDASQARLQSQLAAERASQAARAAARQDSAAAASQLAALALLSAGPPREPLANTMNPNGTMQLATLTPQLGSYFGTDRGVLVVRAPTHGVLKLQDGDVILAIGDRTPTSSSQAIRILTSYDPGEKIRLLVLREHRKIRITATMSAAPASEP